MLSIRTIMRGEKTVRRAASATFRGYEIHMGETIYGQGAKAFAQIVREGEANQAADGAIDPTGRIWGTYVHGIFDDDAFRHAFIETARIGCGLHPAASRVCVTAERERRINRWAAHLRRSLDMDLIRHWMEELSPSESRLR